MKGIVVALNPVREMSIIQTNESGFIVAEWLGCYMELDDKLSNIPYEHESCDIYNQTQGETQEVYIQALDATYQNALALIA